MKRKFWLMGHKIFMLGWLACCIFLQPLLVNADGGSVQSRGSITFQTAVKEDPGGKEPESNQKLPATGELVKGSMILSGGVLIFIFFVVAARRKSKEDDHEKTS
ncbi:LPXTG cell wall anchor domain-containing protein [Enterococcus sp. LJL120]